MEDKYWEESQEFLKVFAKAYGKLSSKAWTKKQYNQYMADFYTYKEMFSDAEYHQKVADDI